MKNLLFFVPLIIGIIIMAIGIKLHIPRGLVMNRLAMSGALVVGSLFFWLSNAMLLAYEGRFYFIFNVITVVAFFLGLALLFPAPPHATRINQHCFMAHLLIWTGLILGIAHSIALASSSTWPTLLLDFCSNLGLDGATVRKL